MEEDTKTRDKTIAFFMVVCCALILYGIFGKTYCWFTGPKLVVILTLGSMYGRLVGVDKNPVAKYLVYGGAALALGIGTHLLTPYFWAARAVQIPFLTAFVITAAISWVYLMKELRKEKLFSFTYHLFCYLPIVVFAGCLLAVNLFGGTLYATVLLDIFYVILTYMLIAKGIKEVGRLYFNSGLLLLWALGTAICLTFIFDLPQEKYIYGVVGLFVVLNMLFSTLERRSKK